MIASALIGDIQALELRGRDSMSAMDDVAGEDITQMAQMIEQEGLFCGRIFLYRGKKFADPIRRDLTVERKTQERYNLKRHKRLL